MYGSPLVQIMETWAELKPDTPFNQIFPDSKVPIKSIVPIIPDSEGSPPCYVIDAAFLSEDQIKELALGLYQTWRPKCTSVAMAIDYIRRGLPLSCEHFSGVATTNPAVLAMLLDDDFDDYEDEEL